MKIKKTHILLLLCLLSVEMFLTGCVAVSLAAIDTPAALDTNLSEKTHTITVVQISDAHFSREKKLFSNMVSLVNSIQPDVILFTGDQAVSQKSIGVMKKYMSAITVPCPKFAINGNWEYMEKIPMNEYEQALQEAGVVLLVNEQRTLDFEGKKLCLYGLDDYLFGVPSFSGFAPEAGAAPLLVGHCPPLFDDAAAVVSSPFCMISGHTHGGQFVFWGNAIYFPVGTGSYYAGDYYSGGNHLYVSTGLGNSTYDIRNVPPVIDVITFTFDENDVFVSMQAQALKVSTK